MRIYKWLRPSSNGTRKSSTRGRIRFAITAMALMGLALALTGRINRASAATITVTNTNDGGGGSLRQAILDAASGDTINFNLPAGSTIVLTSGELLINKSLTISGPGAGQLTVQRSTAMGTPNFRIFDVNAGGATVNVSGLTVTNGIDLSLGGGGFENIHGTLTITGCTITGNSAGSLGGGVDCANGGEVTNIVNCTISNNTLLGSAGFGGGIDNAGTMTITNSTVSGNMAKGPGSFGGGINNFDTLTITNSTISGNTSTKTGGGIENSGTLTILSSTISGNSVTVNQLPEGGGIRNGGFLTVVNSTISGNSANGGNDLRANDLGGIGGGILNQGSVASSSKATLINSTVSGNSATGVLAFGGGIDTESGSSLTLRNTTITANSAVGEDSRGGGIRNGGGANVGNTIIAGNSASSGPDCSDSYLSQGYNLIGNSAGCTGFTATGDQLDKTPQLGPLANNGGPTQTHALLCASPAIDKGSNALAKDQNGNPLTTDQRGAGFPRIFNGTVDVGAFESQLFSCPANIMVSNAANQCGAFVNYTPPSVDPSCGTVSCSPPAGFFFPIGATTVTCMFSAQSCSFTVTVVDTQAPTITCPTSLTAVVPQNACPSANCTVVNYPAPAASDNCPGVSVTCNPPSGSCFALGTTTVSCTATDASGNTATCSFSVAVFDACLQDDSNPGSVLLFNSVTGDYRFCCNGTTYSGRGQVTTTGCVVTLQHSPADRRVTGKVDRATFRGSASLQSPPGIMKCTISDRDVRNNGCTCP